MPIRSSDRNISSDCSFVSPIFLPGSRFRFLIHPSDSRIAAFPRPNDIVIPHWRAWAGRDLNSLELRDQIQLFAQTVIVNQPGDVFPVQGKIRSEERRVGKEWRYRLTRW